MYLHCFDLVFVVFTNDALDQTEDEVLTRVSLSLESAVVRDRVSCRSGVRPVFPVGRGRRCGGVE